MKLYELRFPHTEGKRSWPTTRFCYSRSKNFIQSWFRPHDRAHTLLINYMTSDHSSTIPAAFGYEINPYQGARR